MIDEYKNFWKKVDKTDDCWLWRGAITGGGYGAYSYKRKNWLAHRFSAHISGLDIQDKVVLHKCDNTKCVNPDHMTTGSQYDNVIDAIKKRRHKPPYGMMEEKTVYQIRALAKAGMSGAAIARKLALNEQTTRDVINRKTWKHLS